MLGLTIRNIIEVTKPSTSKINRFARGSDLMYLFLYQTTLDLIHNTTPKNMQARKSKRKVTLKFNKPPPNTHSIKREVLLCPRQTPPTQHTNVRFAKRKEIF
jgi:hypothetical protein